jgi:predicted DNA-binding transcriptional regulator AlpA
MTFDKLGLYEAVHDAYRPPDNPRSDAWVRDEARLAEVGRRPRARAAQAAGPAATARHQGHDPGEHIMQTTHAPAVVPCPPEKANGRPAPPPAAGEEPRATEATGRKAHAAAVLTASVEPLLVDIKQATALCGISEASWYRLKALGRVPAAVKLGARVLWRIDDLRLWVAWGCPDRKTFEARKAAGGGPARPRA